MRLEQRGFSLIELMVASTIGLLLLAATGQIFLSNKQSFTAQEAIGNIQENARLALYLLQRDIRMAGFPKDGNVAAFVTGACPGATACTYVVGGNANNPSTTGALTCAGTNSTAGTFDCGAGQSDQIELQMKGTTDCLGRAVAGPNVANRYFVSIDTSTRVRQLMCSSSNAGGPQPLVEGIESLQVLYGVDANSSPPSPPGVSPVFATRYVRANQLAASDWDKIISVRVGVLASSTGTGARNTAETLAQRYLVLDDLFTVTDALRRRAFASTIEIRNRAPP